MPKGPNGQKRPADAIGCAVLVGKIATGEVVEEVAYVASKTERASAGGKARAQHLSEGERQAIAKAGAEARWNERSVNMTEQARLMRALFEHDGREHVDIKFLRGPAPNLTVEDICREANSAIFQMDNDLVDGDSEFAEEFKQVDVADLVKNL